MSNFDLDLSKFIDESEEIASKILRGTSLGLFKRIVKRTPVDTGRLRANWQIDINSVPAKELKSNDLDGDGRQTVARETSKLGKNKIEDTIYLANNLPYAVAMEEGGSKTQAPQGMVRVSLVELDRELKANVKKFRRV